LKRLRSFSRSNFRKWCYFRAKIVMVWSVPEMAQYFIS